MFIVGKYPHDLTVEAVG